MGYCAYANELGTSCRDYINRALDIAEKRPDYKYVIEHYWMLDAFDKYAEEKDKERLKKYFKSGNIGLGAAFCGVHTAWQSKEQLIRSVQYARECNEKWGISPKTVMYTDISGASSSVISAYYGAGIRYITALENIGFRSRPYRYKFPMLFKWKAKQNDNALICWHQIGYSLPKLDAVWKQLDDFVFDETKADETEKIVNDYIKEVGEDYDIIPLSFYHDRDIPNTYLADICKEMNKRWKSPEFSVSLLDEAFEEIEKSYGDRLPVMCGEMADQWADFATISSKWMGQKRYAQNRIREAEAMSVINSVKNGALYPEDELKKAYWKMGEFDEHCWATSAKNPQKMHIFNMKLMKEQNAAEVQRVTENLIANSIGTAEDTAEKISLWNFVPGQTSRGALLKKPVKGIKCQYLNEEEIITEPIELEGFSGKVFEVDKSADITAKPIKESVIDTGTYIISCNYETGHIVSIKDKQSGQEILDSFAEYRLGDFIYVHDAGAKLTLKDEIQRELSFDVAKTRKFSVEQGEVATVVRKTAYEEQLCANVSMTFIFYKYEKNIDIRLNFKNASSMMGSQLDRYKKNIFFAFPFKMDNHRFYTQTAADVLEEPKDRLKNAPHDFVVAENWVAVEGNDYGIALYSEEMPVFNLGGIHYNELSCDIEHRTSDIYLYAASNRCNQLVYRTVDDCCGEYNLSILPYKGGSNPNRLNLWCEEKTHPLTVGKAEIFESKIEIDNSYVFLTAMKKAENSGDVILRFYNESNTKQHFVFSLPFSVKSAAYVSMNEKEVLGDAEVIDERKLSLSINEGDYITLLVKPENEICSGEISSEPYLDEIFHFVVENDKTVICFKKHNCNNVKGFEVYADGEKILTLQNEEPEVQFCEIEKTGIENVFVKIV